MKAIMNFIREEEGAAAVEYGLLVALIAAVIVLAVTSLGKQVCEGFKYVSGKLVPAATFGAA
ncbi:MAG: Flp family type IVb pilin, partial [Burkholderiales bacterium]